jgi:hypothetical protein
MVFDRKWFNRLYIKWFDGIYSKDSELAEELDIKIISGLGKRMAREIKDIIPPNKNTMEYLLSALKESHWFQEDVQVVAKSDEEMILQSKNCTFQSYMMQKHQEPYYHCTVSHKAFLEEFCKEIDPNIKVENLISPVKNPKDKIYCKWKIYK